MAAQRDTERSIIAAMLGRLGGTANTPEQQRARAKNLAKGPKARAMKAKRKGAK